ncbi:MAG TPA: hypothetical protein VIY69_01910 [Candidatus Acidoferrales bacterium]
MKKPIAFAALLFAALGIASAPAAAQDPVTAVAVAAPIIIHEITPKKSSKTPSGTWMKVEFLHADDNSMVVSEQGNERMIHTFTYNANVKAKMQKIINAGGYQYGDKIKIRYTPGTTVALKIHGKPSKSL